MRNHVHTASARGTWQPLVPARVVLRSCDGRCDARPPAPNTAGKLTARRRQCLPGRGQNGVRDPSPGTESRRSPASNIPDPTADWRGTLLLRLPQVTLRLDARFESVSGVS